MQHWAEKGLKHKPNPLMQNALNWSDTPLKSFSIYCKIFEVCLTTL